MTTINTTQAELPPTKQVSADDDESILRVARTITSAFSEQPLIPAFIVEQDKIPPPYPTTIPFTRQLEHFTHGITNIIKGGAHTVYAGDFSAIAIWFSPTYTGPSFGASRKYTSDLTRELGTKLTAIEHRLFAIPDQLDDQGKPKLRPTWHLQFLARNPDAGIENVKSGISAVMRPFLRRAREDGVPAWLDATSARGVQIYQHYGFRVEEEVKVGVGRLGADGWPQEGGEGVSLWVMVYDQHLR